MKDNPPNEIRKSKSVSEASIKDTMLILIRRELALILVGFIIVIALVAAIQSGAMPILDKFLPAIMLVLGFFFGQKSNHA